MNFSARNGHPNTLHVRGHASDEAIGVSVFSKFENHLHANHISCSICRDPAENSLC